ncbi:MAG: VOC family protein [Pseudomonadota bacterium]
MSIELDHVFWMVPKATVSHVTTRLASLGLRESYRRVHVGQGTANVCYCFENAFLEVLWLENEAEARSAPIARTQLVQRGTGKANPFGICWRGEAGIDLWDFRPPFLPDGTSIPMAVASDDPALPLLFRFPGSKRPIELPRERHGGMQAHAGFDVLELVAVQCESPVALTPILSSMMPAVGFMRGVPGLSLRFTGANGSVKLNLPLGQS